MTGGRAGFTLLEVLISLVLLGVTLLGYQAVITDRLVVSLAVDERRTVANQLAEDRLARIQLDPVFATLEARYEETEDPVPGDPRFARRTEITPSADPSRQGNYLTVTVRVWSTQAPDTVSRTTVIAAP